MPEIFTIGFSEDAFASAVAGGLATPGITPLAATSRFVVGSLLDGLTRTMGPRLIKDPAVNRGTWPARYETLENLASGGAEVWYPELRFTTRPGDVVDDAVVKPSGFRLEPIVVGFGVERFYQLKVRRLKTQANHELRLNHVVLPAGLFAGVADKLKSGLPLSQPYIANPEPHGSARRTDTSLPGFRTVSFDHVQNGTRLFCECGRTAHERMRAEATERVAG